MQKFFKGSKAGKGSQSKEGPQREGSVSTAPVHGSRASGYGVDSHNSFPSEESRQCKSQGTDQTGECAPTRDEMKAVSSPARISTHAEKGTRNTKEHISQSTRSEKPPVSRTGHVTTLNQPGAVSNSQSTNSTATFVSSIDASVHVSSNGNTYYVSDSSTVRFLYGSVVNPTNEKSALDFCLEKLNRSLNAEYNIVTQTTRGPCAPKTRAAILKKLIRWCNTVGIPLYWMNGMAGTGKTTIAYTLCQMLNELNLLGASFFCSRSLPDCRDVNLIIPTIALQLARKYPRFGEMVMASLRDDPDCLHRGLNTQLQKLLIEPWNARKDKLPEQVVIVLDALDECDDKHAEFFRTLFDHAAMLPFKIFISSRPEPSIRESLKSKDPKILSTFILHEVENDLVQADIARFLKAQLSGPWHVASSDISSLASLCGSLFIYAATLVRFLTAPNTNITIRLGLLKQALPGSAKTKAMEDIDELYRSVLDAIFHRDLLEDESQAILEILFTIVCAREPLTSEGLASLWDISVEEIDRRLSPLQSVIYIPKSSSQPVTVFHASFPDFLLDPLRSGKFHLNRRNIDIQLARRCIALMQLRLRQNICEVVGQPPNSSISPDVIRSHVSPGLRYAVVYWIEHLVLSDPPSWDHHLNSVRVFMVSHMLHWLECLSLVQRLPVSIQSLERLQHALRKDDEMLDLASNFLRLIQHIYEPVEYSAVRVYSSALIWTPTHSILRRCIPNLNDSEGFPRVISGLPSSWTGPDRVIDVSSEYLTSVVVSQDGNRVVFGSQDGGIHIWNLQNQVEEAVLIGHTTFANFISISMDGKRLVSGSLSGAVRVWDTETQKASLRLQEPGGIWAVAVSLDGKWVGLGRREGGISIWETENCKLLHTIQGYSVIKSLAFIPNSTLLVSASDHRSAHVWNILEGKIKHSLHGHTHWVISVACSALGDKIVTGSEDRLAYIWDISGRKLQALMGHSDSVGSVAFMPNGKQVVTGSDDKTLRIWDAASGHTICILTSTERVRSIAVFPDGIKIASRSVRGISIWSMRGGPIKGSTNKVDASDTLAGATSVVFSPNGHQVLLLPSLIIVNVETQEKKMDIRSQRTLYVCAAWSPSGNKIAAAEGRKFKVWVLKRGKVMKKIRLGIKGYVNDIYSVSFSTTEERLALVADDKTVRIWNIVAGRHIRLHRHSSRVYQASFSRGDNLLLTSARDAVRLLDAQSGELLHQFDATAQSARFTPDSRFIIMEHNGAINLWNAQSYHLEYTHEGHNNWTTLEDGTSYALDMDGWLCCFVRFGHWPKRLVWIPPLYRPTLFTHHSLLVTADTKGVRVCLPQQDRFTTLLIPYNY